MSKNDTPLSLKLSALKKDGRYPMHMPGHKRNVRLIDSISDFNLPYDIDITEIDGFDNLHNCEGLLEKLSERCARIYGAAYSFPLVNGSTCGILSCIRAVTKPCDRVIMARNCHKAVYNAVSLCSLEAEYIYAEYCFECGIVGSVKPEDVRAAFEKNPDAKMLIITSPTYEGVISDIEEIAKIVHKYGALLFVDAAHGAHLSVAETRGFADNKIRFADMAVVSLHKTLPALTQTALALVFGENSGRIVPLLSRQINVFETSSPSYILLSSVEQCMNIVEKNGMKLYELWKNRIDLFEQNILKLRNIKIFGYGDCMNLDNNVFDFDKSKVNILCGSCTFLSNGRPARGADIALFLRDNKIEPEMTALNYTVLMTSFCDTDEAYSKLFDVLLDFDSMLVSDENHKINIDKGIGYVQQWNQTAMKISEAEFLEGSLVDLGAAAGKISLDYVFAYPPGIPLIVPGEIISQYAIKRVEVLLSCGITVENSRNIRVL